VLWVFQELHGITSQITAFFIVTAVRTSNLKYLQVSEILIKKKATSTVARRTKNTG
jgi:hypothetical protein